MSGAAASSSKGLGRQAIRGAGFEVVGFGLAQVIRLAGNLLLTRFLEPGAFGLMALVMLVNYGLNMFSDFGFQAALVQHERGGDERFLNTAWTMQMVRGLALGVLVLAFAWPMGKIYGEPQLTELLLVGALGPAAYGLTSTGIYALRRQVRVGPLVIFEICMQIATLAVMLTLAHTLRTVWALVIGLVISSFIHAGASYFLPTPHRHRLAWDREAVRAIMNFGRWIMPSSMVTFVSRQSDRLILGKLLGVTQLGIYSLAVMMADAMGELVQRVMFGVAFPLLSRAREEGEARMRRVFLRSHLVISSLALPTLGALAALGTLIVELLYDERYQAAGWMLQALTVRVAMSCILVQYETWLTSMGWPKYALLQNTCRAVWVVIAVPVGFHFFGVRGIVGAMMLSEIPIFFVITPPMWRARLVHPLSVIAYPALFGAGYALGSGVAWVVRGILHAHAQGV